MQGLTQKILLMICAPMHRLRFLTGLLSVRIIENPASPMKRHELIADNKRLIKLAAVKRRDGGMRAFRCNCWEFSDGRPISAGNLPFENKKRLMMPSCFFNSITPCMTILFETTSHNQEKHGASKKTAWGPALGDACSVSAHRL